MNIVIRADSSIHIGSGHIMRCLVLATELVKQGHDVCFASRPQQGDLIQFIRDKGFLVKELITPANWSIPKNSADYEAWLQVPWLQDANNFIEQADDVDLVIVDHYGINAEWELHIKKQLPCRIFAIDDLLRSHNAEVVLDQTLLREPSEYKDAIESGVALTGCDFALLNPCFSEYRVTAPKNSALSLKPKVLISMGGIDDPNATLAVLSALSKIKGDKPSVTVLLNLKAPNYQSVSDFCKQNTTWISHIDFVDNMAELMSKHHIAIGAPGTTSWERACLGIPSIIVPLADNQKTISKALVKVGAAIRVELSKISTELLSAYHLLLDDWAKMREINLSLCDGLGLFRAVRCISQLEEFTDSSILLRAAKQSDIKTVYDWQVLPETRKYALTKSVPTWEEHNKWMKTKLKVFSDYFYIIESLQSSESIGVLRLDKQENGDYVVSIFIDPNYFGKGYAKAALKYIDYLHPNITIKAIVLEENNASQRLFSVANYHQISSDTFIRYPLPAT